LKSRLAFLTELGPQCAYHCDNQTFRFPSGGSNTMDNGPKRL